jgi:hypothetical protein
MLTRFHRNISMAYIKKYLLNSILVLYVLGFIDNRFFRIRWRCIIKKLFPIFLGLMRGLVEVLVGRKRKKNTVEVKAS